MSYEKPSVVTLTVAELENASLSATLQAPLDGDAGCGCQCQCQCQCQTQ